MDVKVKFPGGNIREVPSHIHTASKEEVLGHKFLRGGTTFVAAEWVPDEDPKWNFYPLKGQGDCVWQAVPKRNSQILDEHGNPFQRPETP